jgi:hypothetical protein
MLRIAILLATALTLLSAATTASAVGEIFPVRLRGWEHCIGDDSTRLTSRTATPLWLRVNEQAHSWDLSYSPDFPDDPAQTFPLVVENMVRFRVNRLAFWARSFSLDGNDNVNGYMTISGYLYVDPSRNEIKGLRGTFIEVGMFDLACGSSGKISTGRRLD